MLNDYLMTMPSIEELRKLTVEFAPMLRWVDENDEEMRLEIMPGTAGMWQVAGVDGDTVGDMYADVARMVFQTCLEHAVNKAGLCVLVDRLGGERCWYGAWAVSSMRATDRLRARWSALVATARVAMTQKPWASQDGWRPTQDEQQYAAESVRAPNPVTDVLGPKPSERTPPEPPKSRRTRILEIADECDRRVETPPILIAEALRLLAGEDGEA